MISVMSGMENAQQGSNKEELTYTAKSGGLKEGNWGKGVGDGHMSDGWGVWCWNYIHGKPLLAVS